MKEFIYADNAATTRIAPEALDAMMPFLTEEYGNASQPYSFSRPARRALKDARETIATCIGAMPGEVFFTSGGTESDNWVLKSVLMNDADHKGLITSSVEHHAILHSGQTMERLGYHVTYLPVSNDCLVSPADLEKTLASNTTSLVSIMFANNEVGSIQPVEELAHIAHAHSALFHTDAVQAVGHVAINVHKLGIDFLSSSAHKYNGPKGVGFLFIRQGCKLAPYADGGAQESGLRAGTENVASIVGMATALKLNCDELEQNKARLLSLESLLIDTLRHEGIDFIHNGAKAHVPGNVSLSFRGADGEMLLHRLDLMGICVSTGSACDSKNTQISHVLNAMAVPEEYARGTIRISLGRYNTQKEVSAIAQSIIKILHS